MILCLLISITSLAASKPSWTSKPPQQDAKFVYYVGRGQGEKDFTTAFRTASLDARIQLIESNYGSFIKINSKVKEDLKKVSYELDAETVLPDVSLKGIELSEVYQEETSQKSNVWVLLRYSKVELEAETKRQESLKKAGLEFSQTKLRSNAKIYKNMPIKALIENFGNPERIRDSYSAFVFTYSSKDFCEATPDYSCQIYASSKKEKCEKFECTVMVKDGQVSSFSEFKAQFISLDALDKPPEPNPCEKGKIRKGLTRAEIIAVLGQPTSADFGENKSGTLSYSAPMCSRDSRSCLIRFNGDGHARSIENINPACLNFE